MNIVKIDLSQIALLQNFIANMGESATTFRYFNSRSPEIIANHVLTLLGLDDHGKPICYGHLDPEGGKVWLGICVIASHTGKGLGKAMLRALLDAGDAAGIPLISLSVDLANRSAVKLYESAGFKQIRTKDTIAFYERNLER